MRYTIITNPHLAGDLGAVSTADSVALDSMDDFPGLGEFDMIGQWFCDGGGDGFKYIISRPQSELLFEFFADGFGSAEAQLCKIGDQCKLWQGLACIL